ncbi:unnamed protein product [Brassica oleracea var. botrytis]|uniref:Uncharacterized protein n=1 Tax=Brassica oleracea TaxID=3712 RepID=A0A3P6EJN4_BRAOL|nr:unnamed protein product [Brassica oleracea]
MVSVDSTAVKHSPSNSSTRPVKTGSETLSDKFTILRPKPSSPLQTNRAASKTKPLAMHTSSIPTSVSPCSYTVPPSPSDPSQTAQKAQESPLLPSQTPISSDTHPSPNPPDLPPPQSKPHPNPKPASPVNPIPTLVEKIRRSEDKTLRRLAPIQFSESGRPRVLIPDEIFQKGADLHKDFITSPLQPNTKCSESYVGERKKTRDSQQPNLKVCFGQDY